jgi:hypothetical protein
MSVEVEMEIERVKARLLSHKVRETSRRAAAGIWGFLQLPLLHHNGPSPIRYTRCWYVQYKSLVQARAGTPRCASSGSFRAPPQAHLQPHRKCPRSSSTLAQHSYSPSLLIHLKRRTIQMSHNAPLLLPSQRVPCAAEPSPKPCRSLLNHRRSSNPHSRRSLLCSSGPEPPCNPVIPP